MKRYRKIVLGILAGLLLIIGGILLTWKVMRYSPSVKAESASRSGQVSDSVLYFDSQDSEKPLVIFYSGALVDASSYSIWAQGLAKDGYSVAIVKMPFDLAVLGGNKGEEVLANYPHKDYVIGGHSLGGVMASRFAAQQLESESQQLKGVFFLASYPDEKGSLEESELPVLSLTASKDKVLDKENYDEAKEWLPDQTVYEEIKGGNHAGFGSYGAQRKDGKAEITNQKQQTAIVQKMSEWLENIE